MRVVPLVIVACALVACSAGDQHSFDEARPKDVRMIASARIPGGSAGGGAQARVFVTESDFSDTLSRYQDLVSQNGGVSMALADGVGKRFDLGGDCIELIPWERESLRFPIVVLRLEITDEEKQQLDATKGAFVETRPLDCKFKG